MDHAERPFLSQLLSKGTPWLVLFPSLLITWFSWQLTEQNSRVHAEHQFSNQIMEHTAAISNRMVDYQQALQSGVSFMNASQDVTREEWKVFVKGLGLGELYPGIQGMGWTIFIQPSELEQHVARIRGEGFPNYSVRPEGKRDIYSSIIYLEPFEKRNLRAFGFDMFSEAVRRKAMSFARDSGQAALSGKVTLVQEDQTEPQAGTLLYVPVYKSGMPVETVEERQKAIVGFVYAPFRMNDLMEGILGNKFSLVSLHIYDGVEVDPQALMYDSHRKHKGQHYSSKFRQVQHVRIAHQTWTLEFIATPAFEDGLDRDKSNLVLLAGLLSSLLLFALVQSLVTSRNRALVLATAMTSDLSASEERSRVVLEVAVTGMIVIDQKGTIQSYNPAAEKIFGYPSQEVIGKNVNCLMPEPYHSDHDQFLGNYLRTGKPKVIGVGREVVGLRQNGQTFPMLLSVGEAKLSEEHLFVGSVVDITEQKNSQALIQEHLHLMRLRASVGTILIQPMDLSEMLRACCNILVNELRVAFVRVWLFNPEDQTLYLHASAGIYTHLNGEHGRIPLGAFKIGQIAATRTPHMTNQVVGDPRVSQQEWAKQEGMVAFAGHPLVADGQLVGVLGMFSRQPLSEMVFSILGAIANELALGIRHKMAAMDLLKAKEIAESANQAKSEFLNMMSHELRTPLTVILGYLPLLVEPAQKLPLAKKLLTHLEAQPEVREDLARLLSKIGQMSLEMKRNGEHLLTLITDLLDISKIEAGKLTLSLERLVADQVVDSLVRGLSMKASEKGIALVVACGGEPLLADYVRLKQILLNLVGNAIKFTEQGQIAITTRRTSGMVEFAIKDSGVGIPAKDLSLIFERFHQVDSSSTRKVGGTGLGLTITKRLVELHGGTISVTSVVGEGSEFRFTIPTGEG
ncbi:MAG: PAS domain S-box protein [Magnetococcales bacterium]|nr:CHASE domain-containing protein [Magnetococcales bacterium]NGZ26766.1 PAS domain S-box protein [Magnetococcales bacterium]